MTSYYDMVFFFKQNPAYDVRINDWISDVCSSDLRAREEGPQGHEEDRHARRAAQEGRQQGQGLIDPPGRRGAPATADALPANPLEDRGSPPPAASGWRASSCDFGPPVRLRARAAFILPSPRKTKRRTP